MIASHLVQSTDRAPRTAHRGPRTADRGPSNGDNLNIDATGAQGVRIRGIVKCDAFNTPVEDNGD